jgi:hypothetical protein
LPRTGVAENPQGILCLTAYPNPFDQFLRICYNLNSPSPVNIQMTDLSGRIIFNKVLLAQNAGKYYFDADVSEGRIKAGLYFIKINTDTGFDMLKVLKIE